MSYVRDGGTWKELKEVYVRQAGAWVEVKEGYVRDAGTWKRFFQNTFVFEQVISTDTQGYNLRSAAIAAGWDATRPLDATVTINAGVSVFASGTGSYAFVTGTGSQGVNFPQGSILRLINNGNIVGRGGNGGPGGPTFTNGGAGGPALLVQFPITITNNFLIGGGGGGGGGGGQAARDGFAAGGGGGGGGRGPSAGGPGSVNQNVNGQPGAPGTLFGPGGGGAGSSINGATAGAGGVGGGVGSAGATGVAGFFQTPVSFSGSSSGGRFGGLAGNAVVGNNNITWLSQGTILGGIVA